MPPLFVVSSRQSHRDTVETQRLVDSGRVTGTMSGMVLTAEQMRQVRLNQPSLTWQEQEVIFRRNWQALTGNTSGTASETNSSNGQRNATSSPRLPAARLGVVGCLK